MVENYYDIPKQMMTIDQFNDALLNHCKTDLQRVIMKDLIATRPGWVSNIMISDKIHDFVAESKVWGVENPTEKDLIQVIRDHTTDNLDMVEILMVIRKYTDKV